MADDKKSLDQDIEKNKSLAMLSYLWILCLLPLLTKKQSKFTQFHAKQGFVLFVAEVICTPLYMFPFFGQMLALLFFVLSVVGIVKTLNGEWWKIPYVYEWSKKINF